MSFRKVVQNHSNTDDQWYRSQNNNSGNKMNSKNQHQRQDSMNSCFSQRLRMVCEKRKQRDIEKNKNSSDAFQQKQQGESGNLVLKKKLSRVETCGNFIKVKNQVHM